MISYIINFNEFELLVSNSLALFLNKLQIKGDRMYEDITRISDWLP